MMRDSNSVQTCVFKFAEKDHDVVLFHGARPDWKRLHLLENPRLVKRNNMKNSPSHSRFNDVDSAS